MKRISYSAIVSFLFAFALLLYAATPAVGLGTYWQHDPATPGDWHNPANWNNGIPDSNDWAYIDNGGTAHIFANAGLMNLIAGHQNSGAVEQTGGTHMIEENLLLGCRSPNSSGTYNLIDGELSVNSEVFIGSLGTGVFNQTGGTHTIYAYLGINSPSGSAYNLVAGTLSVGFDEKIGYQDLGEINQSGGTNTARSLFLSGYSSSGKGTYNMSDGALSIDIYEYVGYRSAGEFNQTGGTNTVGEILYLGYDYNSSGTYTLSAGTLSVGTQEFIGHRGKGEFNQSGGTHTIGGSMYIGWDSGSSGEYNFLGGSLAVGDLDINSGWMDIDINMIDFFRVEGDKVGLLDGYILDGKIFDSSLCPGGYLYAVYDSGNDWTTLGAIPEPGTVVMIGVAVAGLAGIIRRRFK